MYDCIVVGAGIEGSATAYHLAKMGRKTLLLEQFPLPHTRGSSHGASRITRKAYEEDVFAEMMVEAYELWEQLEKESAQTLFNEPSKLTSKHMFDKGNMKCLATNVWFLHLFHLLVSIVNLLAKSFNEPELFHSLSVYPCDDIDLLLFAPQFSPAYQYCICPPGLEDLLILHPQRWCLRIETRGTKASRRVIDSMHGYSAYLDFSFKALTPGPFSNGTCSLRYNAYQFSYQLAPIFPVRYNCSLEFTAFKETLQNVTTPVFAYYSISSPCCPVARVPYYENDLSSCILQENTWYALEGSSETITKRYRKSKYEWKTERQWWLFKTAQNDVVAGEVRVSEQSVLLINIAKTEACIDFTLQRDHFTTDENSTTLVTSVMRASTLSIEYVIQIPTVDSPDYLNNTQVYPVLFTNGSALPDRFCWLVGKHDALIDAEDGRQSEEDTRPMMQFNCDTESCRVIPTVPTIIEKPPETLPQQITFGIFAVIIIFLICALCYRCTVS